MSCSNKVWSCKQSFLLFLYPWGSGFRCKKARDSPLLHTMPFLPNAIFCLMKKGLWRQKAEGDLHFLSSFSFFCNAYLVLSLLKVILHKLPLQNIRNWAMLKFCPRKNRFSGEELLYSTYLIQLLYLQLLKSINQGLLFRIYLDGRDARIFT